MDLKLIDAQGQAAGNVEAPDTVFARDFNEALIHQVVIAYQANARSGNRAQKGRADINKSHKKPWKQKGTGRARAGQANSPIWRGGGKAFPNLPDENFSHKLNKKMYRAGMCSILSQLAREERLVVIDDIKVDAPKTKMLAEKVKGFGFDTSVLFITGARDENLTLASRNLMNVSVLDAQNADPVSLVNYDRVLLTKGAVERMKEIFA